MSLDLGDLEELAAALGLVADDTLVTDWFARPGHYLSSMLREQRQRDALVAFTDRMLGGDDASTDAQGRQWLPLVGVGDGAFAAYAVIEVAGGRVQVGAGARVDVTSQSGVRCAVEAVAPLFGQPLAGGDVVAVLGSTGAFVDLSLDLTFPGGTASADVALAGAALDVAVPTWSGGTPTFGLTLRGLRLPGVSAASDVEVTGDSLDQLDDALLGLVLGLVRAQAAALAGTEPLAGLAAMLGLAGGGVPDFPLDDVLRRGAAALADWLTGMLADDTARAAWLGGLATLVGGTVQGPGAAAHVELALAPATLQLSLASTPGAGGRPRLTPTVSLRVSGAGGVLLALEVDPVTLDLGTGSAVAVPRLSVTARVTGAGGTPLLAPAGAGLERVGIAELRAGFALDPSRRPMLVVEARDADVGATHFDVLDLTSPDALAAAAAEVVTGAAASLLDALGPAGDAVALVLGIPLPTAPALPAVDAARLLSDPLGALADRWRRLLAGAPADVATVLEAVRDLLADTAAQAAAVTGTGTVDDPWIVPVVDGVTLAVRSVDALLRVGVVVARGPGPLGGSGVAAALALEATLAELGLGDGTSDPVTSLRHAAFLPDLTGRLSFTAAGAGPLALGETPVALLADALGLAVSWTAPGGARVAPVATGVRLALASGGTLDLPVPVVGPDGGLTLDDAGWAALETLVGAVAQSLAGTAGLSWVADAVGLVGWSPGAQITSRAPGKRPVPSGPRLSLAGLVSDPATTLSAYLGSLLDVGSATSGVEAVLDVLSLLTGPASGRYGGGGARDPWRLPLIGAALDALGDAVPALLAWLGPDGPPAAGDPFVSPLYGWQPGEPPLATTTLVAGIAAQAAQDDVLADLLAGRADLVAGLEELVVRWTGTDGLVALTETGLPGGITPHRLSDIDHSTPLSALDLTAVVGALPATVVQIAVDAPTGRSPVLADVPADHAVDLTATGLPPEAFTVTLPGDPTGVWAVRLAPRAAARATGSGTTDPDGVLGQAGRVARVLRPLAAAGPVLVVAHGGAGQPAVRAASTLAAEGLAVTAVVTVGTPWTALAVDTLDRLPGADALRLLGAMLPPAPDPTAETEDPDDEDLATARRVLAVWTELDALGDPLADLRPPSAPTPTTGVTVHACVGALGEAAVRRAITAAVVTALVERAWQRAENPVGAPALTRFGMRWPLLPPAVRAGLTTSLTLDLDLAGTTSDADGAHAATSGPVVVLKLALGGADGSWLLGGPDPARAPGSDRPLGLRRLTARVDVPLGGGAASARIDLHDAFALGVRRSRWTVAGGAAAPADATPALPEVRALLGGAVARLTAGAGLDPLLAGLLDALRAVGVVGVDGGLDAVTLDRVLLDTAGVVASVARRRPAGGGPRGGVAHPGRRCPGRRGSGHRRHVDGGRRDRRHERQRQCHRRPGHGRRRDQHGWNGRDRLVRGRGPQRRPADPLAPARQRPARTADPRRGRPARRALDGAAARPRPAGGRPGPQGHRGTAGAPARPGRGRAALARARPRGDRPRDRRPRAVRAGPDRRRRRPADPARGDRAGGPHRRRRVRRAARRARAARPRTAAEPRDPRRRAAAATPPATRPAW